MTVYIQNASIVNAEGTRKNRNSKPVLCITTGEVYASATDAAEVLGVTPSAMSWVLTGRTNTCKGKRFCYISKVTEHLDEITECMRIREAKAAAYDEMTARKEVLRKAKEKFEKHKSKVEALQNALEEEMLLMEEAENEWNALKNTESEE